MTTPTTPERGPAAYLRRRTGLVIPLLLLATGTVLAIGTFTMDVPANVASPGPQLFPLVIAAACLVFAVLLGIETLRTPEPAEVADPATPASADTPAEEDTEGTASAASASGTDTPATRIRSNRPAVAGVVGTVVAFIALLEPLGWLICGALLFWGVARSLGSRRPVFDLFLSLALSSLVQLAFSAGLGLGLPPGVLAGVL
ncbi:tripartite tricarboxylate transporter TctB family protein [Streptomyces sp. NPDC006296]|uniref:tripartite tricarboxylate transporter TctB family protein n=1 Tax=Streptomyces sp. NPDC006296 TaxID=3156746 RepID=UPI0033A8B6C6